VGPTPAEAWRFDDGITLSGISAPWLSFAVVSADGRPLAESHCVYLTAMADAVNSSFDFDWSTRGGPVDQAKAIRDHGRAPVRVDKVDYTISFPRVQEWKVDSYDFALREIASTSGESSEIRVRAQPPSRSVVPNDRAQEIWMNRVELKNPGAWAKPVLDASPGARLPLRETVVPEAETTDAALIDLWNPLPGLSWGDNYPLAHRKMREMPVRHRGVSRYDPEARSSNTVEVTDAFAAFNAPARVEVVFEREAMVSIVFTFTQPPAFRAAVDDYQNRFGSPVEKRLTDNPFEQSTVRWTVPSRTGELFIEMTEAQGVMKVIYLLRRK
jgi:hypothetical protein